MCETLVEEFLALEPIPESFKSTSIDGEDSTIDQQSLKSALIFSLRAAQKLETNHLYHHAAQAYYCSALMVICCLEMIPASFHKSGQIDKYDWLFGEAGILERIVDCQSRITNNAFHHSNTSTIKGVRGEKLFHEFRQRIRLKDCLKPVCSVSFLDSSVKYKYLEGRNRIKKINFNYSIVCENDKMPQLSLMIYWNYSRFGQMVSALSFWYDLIKTTSDGRSDAALILQVDIEKLLPMSERFYPTMLWLNARASLLKIKSEYIKYGKLSKTQMFELVASQVNLYRATQYMSQLTENNRNITIPPNMFINFHMWELCYFLVMVEIDNDSDNVTKSRKEAYDFAVSKVRLKYSGGEYLSMYKDVSSRVLDLDLLAEQSKTSFTEVNTMSDLTSKRRMEIFSSKSFLDDDYEDIYFTMDWAFVRSFSCSASFYIRYINKAMSDIMYRKQTLKL